MSRYHPSSDKRLTAALDSVMTTSDPLARLGATRNAGQLVRASFDRQLLELIDDGFTQTEIARGLGVTQQAVSRMEDRARTRLTSLRAHRKYIQNRPKRGSH